MPDLRHRLFSTDFGTSELLNRDSATYHEWIYKNLLNTRIQEILVVMEGTDAVHPRIWYDSYAQLSLAYAYHRNKELALDYYDRAFNYINPSIDAALGSLALSLHYEVLIYLEEYLVAILAIREELDSRSGGYKSIHHLKLDPLYDPLRDMPEFQAILEDSKYQLNQSIYLKFTSSRFSVSLLIDPHSPVLPFQVIQVIQFRLVKCFK